MSNVNIIGEVSRLAGNKLKIVEYEGERYFCNDIDIFNSASPAQRAGQKIDRVIDRMIFYSRGALEIYAFTDYERATLDAIQESDTDPLLLEIVKMCHGADSSDIEIFKFCKKVSLFKELPELGSDLGRGLGFPGKGFGLIVAHFDFPLYKRRVYLQIVHSYDEGYSVEHQELTPEIFALSHLPGIEQLLNNE